MSRPLPERWPGGSEVRSSAEEVVDGEISSAALPADVVVVVVRTHKISLVTPEQWGWRGWRFSGEGRNRRGR